ncbi:MAG: GIN domain-containing protein [Wenyingzhuangia sp.]|jgi:hypothetical protein|uniref:GIN domain-containing protein n=1 Tax=Wenyingzhuangia sp. TaxID=1964193 RepID=UPI00321B60AF
MNRFIFFFLISNVIFSQSITRKLDTFKSIKISSAIEVILETANHSKIEVTGSDIDKLQIKNKNQELHLFTSLDKKFKNDLKVHIYYEPGLRYLKLTNSVKIHSKTPIHEEFFEIEANHNVKAVLRLKTKHLVAKLKLGSNITLKGTTESQKIYVGAKCFYHAFQFISKQTTISANASLAEIHVSEFLEATAKFKAEIIYRGQPNSVNEKTLLGKVIRK